MVLSYEELTKIIKPNTYYSLNFIISQHWLSSVKDRYKPLSLQVLKDLTEQMVFIPIETPTITLIQGEDILLRKKLYDQGFGYERYGLSALGGLRNRLKRQRGTIKCSTYSLYRSKSYKELSKQGIL